jgi:TonB family protein
VQSTRHDSNLAALQAGAGLPGHVLDVVVLTADPGVLATLREASGPEHAIWHASSADNAVDLLVSGRCCILVADLGTLRGDAAALLDRLHVQFPELILMATGRREEEHTVAMLVSDGRIYRYLHKPVSPARASLFLAAATRRYNELRSSVPVALTTVKTIAARPNVARIAIAVIALLAAVIGFALWQRIEKPSAVPTAPLRQAGTFTQQETIADYLARGQMALGTGRLLEPRGNNALEYFRAVLALQPDNAGAHTGIERIGIALETRVVEALQARDPARGATALTALQHAIPDYPRLDSLRAELLTLSRGAHTTPISSTPAAAPASQPVATKAPVVPNRARVQQTTAPANAQRAQPRARTPPPTPPAASERKSPGPGAEELNAVAKLRSRGALIAPANDNAYDQLLALRERYPDANEIRIEQQQLAFAMLERTRTALAAGDIDGAAAFLSRVDTLAPNMIATKALQTQLATAQQQRAAASSIVQAKMLKRLREVPPAYPREAERLRIKGWVDIEFTIARDGSTRDLVVRNAEPLGTFDQSALESVKRWRFEPVMKNGAAVEQRAAIRIRFELQ